MDHNLFHVILFSLAFMCALSLYCKNKSVLENFANDQDITFENKKHRIQRMIDDVNTNYIPDVIRHELYDMRSGGVRHNFYTKQNKTNKHAYIENSHPNNIRKV